MDNLKYVKSIIEKSKTIVLATHIRADGDAVGSVGAMYHFLKELGKQVYMLLPDLSDNFYFLPGIDERVETLSFNEYDLLICLDTSSEDRLNIPKEDRVKAKCTIVIDHHRNNMINADVKLVNEDAPANCEIIYDIIKFIGNNVSKNIAEYIYMGIMTDTGSFNYEGTSSKTHNIAGEMIDAGADYVRTCKILNHTYSEKRIKLLSQVVSSMETYLDGKIRIGITDIDTIDMLQVKENDVQSIVNSLKGIEGTIVAVYIRALDKDEYKVSVRADEPIDASEISLIFGGGGHKRAAGFSTENVEKTKLELIEILERLLESENNRNT